MNPNDSWGLRQPKSRGNKNILGVSGADLEVPQGPS
jgi:hypothetical protein